MLLKEVRVLTDLQVISESRDTGVMCIRGTFQRAEEANHNQRIYPKAVLENCVKSLSEKLSGRELVGELDHPADGVVKLQNASHLITKLEWQGNDLIGEAEILPTPAGQIAKSLINAGVKIGISSRGMGTLSESVKGAKIVNDDYKMITFDLVADPSTKGAYPSLAESRQHAMDFVKNVIKPAISEKAFVARLKKALNENKSNSRGAGFDALSDEEKAAFELNTSETDANTDPTDVVNALKKHPNNPDNRSTPKPKPKPKPKPEPEEVEEMCGPKHNKKKNTRKLNPIVDSVVPLTLSNLLESNSDRRKVTRNLKKKLGVKKSEPHEEPSKGTKADRLKALEAAKEKRYEDTTRRKGMSVLSLGPKGGKHLPDDAPRPIPDPEDPDPRPRRVGMEENSSRIPLTLPRLEEGLAGFATRIVRDPLRAMQQQRMAQRAGGFVGKGLGAVAGGAIGGLGGALIGKGAAGMKRGASFGKKVGGAVGDVAGQTADGAARITQQELLNPTVAGAKKADSYLGNKAAQSAAGIKTATKMVSAKAKPFVKGAMNKAAFKAGQFTRKGLDLYNRAKQARNATKDAPMGGPPKEENPTQAQTPTFGAVPGGQTTPRPAGSLRRIKAKVD